VIVFGGVLSGSTSFLNDTWAYDPSANTWTELTPSGTLPSRRHDQAMVYDPSGNRMIMFGGFASSSRLNDTWVYTP
jgi:N-acetylneuraminic acid mutarotase